MHISSAYVFIDRCVCVWLKKYDVVPITPRYCVECRWQRGSGNRVIDWCEIMVMWREGDDELPARLVLHLDCEEEASKLASRVSAG